MEKNKKIKIIILSVLLAVVLICIATFSTIEIVKIIKKNKENKNNSTPEIVTPIPDDKKDIFTNSHNEAIAKKILTTNNYSGTYAYAPDRGVTVYYYNNPSDEERKQIQIDRGCLEEDIDKAGLVNPFKELLIKEKREKSKNETIVIKKTINPSTGINENFGYYNIKQNNTIIQQGKVYGDENLAVIVNDLDQNVHTFISLNYTTMADAIEASNTKQTLDGEIYVFENTYDDNGVLLYTVGYTYIIV